MLEIYCLLIFCFIFQRSDAECSQQAVDVFRFGPKCGFMCHCRNNEQCDDTTGECTSGCASFWYGPGCQYRDIVEGEFSRHSDNLPPQQEKYSILAHDNDSTTCSYTADVGSTNKKRVKPFWRVWLPTNETISEIQMVTLPDKLHNFVRFSIYVEYVPSDYKLNSSYVSPYRQKCYQQNSLAPENETFTVLCSSPVVGNQVRIELAKVSTQLVLCDVKINGGRNVAFGRHTLQSSKPSACSEPGGCISNNSVDGIDSSVWKQCSFTDYETDPWWTVDLGHKASIRYIRIMRLEKAKAASYKVELSNTTNSDQKIIYDVQLGTSTNISLITDAKIINLTMKGMRRVEVCEVNVFGDCLEDICGYDCTEECHCKDANIRDKITGYCSSGCKGRWTGPKCDKLCERTHWGLTCENDCGYCANSESCDVITGFCLSGCRDGYAQPNCSTRTGCGSGQYGTNCSRKCSENCENECDHINGHCRCKAGWMGQTCEQACASGYFGDRCSRRCNKWCISGKCHHVDGRCTNGCLDGWIGRKCDKRCGSGQYGKNCSSKCSINCKNECDHKNGHCRCKAGWMGQTCGQGCDLGSYGMNCTRRCSTCKGGKCSNVDGRCLSRCNAGWKGQKCDQECNDGTFGYYCSMSCSRNCKNDDPCEKVYGACPNGCKLGFREDSCSHTCARGQYGENCKHKCSQYCLGGTCSHIDGRCLNSCVAGWTGLKCEERCQNGMYGKNCSGKCEHCKDGNYKCNHINGRCRFGCKAGWKGYTCDQVCTSGNYGENCRRKCSQHCVGGNCGREYGRCTSGCRDGWTGMKCDQRCQYGMYGKNCSRQCSDYCKNGKRWCSHVNGRCQYGCKAGWKGDTCDQECEDGTFGINCLTNCSGNCKNDEVCVKVNGSCRNGCKPGYEGKLCALGCRLGFYGINCSSKCSEKCNGGYAACSKVNGSCLSGCHDGWNGHRCDRKCDNGWFGQGCLNKCSLNCKDGDMCDEADGQCPNGCKPGYTGKMCTQNCTVGFFGDECRHNCSGYCDGGSKMCSNIDGHCMSGCKTGWKGTKCDTECSDGFYGFNCAKTCGKCKSGTVCHNVDGTCNEGCEAGYSGETCLQDCIVGFYGEECRNNCSSHCEGGSEMCNKIDGHCLSGCKAGWKGVKCDTECSDGFYGINCSATCGNCKSGTLCHKVVGTCSAGCESGYSGDHCLQGLQKSDNIVATTTVGVVALVILLIIVTVIAVIYRKRKEQRQRQEQTDTNLQLTSAVSRRNCDNVHLNAEAAGNTEENSFSTSEVNVSNNDPSVSKTKHTVPLSSLLADVKRNLANSGYFEKEFQKLPYGMKYPATVGVNPYNRKKNKYKDMQAYDHTRVMLKTLPKEQGSDYINANFIKGHAKEKAYIAAQGNNKIIYCLLCIIYHISLDFGLQLKYNTLQRF
ncbi:multiple epidermal growth factor-like domains protein 10 [Mercenaria mercenaria]|uniref:multiple epidermal growth factor-like domains protein 10 n=1 Tax=Mercenaria mercenaria TaxID=6596 RepID=UPI00234F425C|nr:multiple epidermal growth factor-like domains protein 10 [Mercenaria mercenaria]